MTDNSLEAVETNVEAAPSTPAEDVKEVEQDLPEGKSQENDEAVEGDAPDAEEPEVELSADALEWKEKFEKTQQATQKRIDRQTAANRQLQEQLNELTQRLEKSGSGHAEESNAPKQEDFDSYDDYIEAVTDYKAEQKAAAKERELLEAQKAAKQQEIYEAKQKQYESRVEAVKAEKPDYHEKEVVVEEIVDFAMKKDGVTDTIRMLTNAVLESENGARLVYELGNNPDKLEDMLAMNPYEAVRELVMLENLPKAVEKPKTPPQPIKPSSGSGKPNTPLTKKSEAEFKKWLTS